MNRRTLLRILAVAGAGLLARRFSLPSAEANEMSKGFEVTKTDEEWRKILTPEQYHILREAGTEKPFKNAYHDNKKEGIYDCAGCDLPLFSSKAKYDSHTGWPSFWEPISPTAIGTKTDWKLLYPRTEVHCARCGGHLGHVFKDGPPPTYLRYCMNSAALVFKPA
jgi:peptide-methionine (R)-S-oxide reductase